MEEQREVLSDRRSRERVREASDHELLVSILDRVSALEQLTSHQLQTHGDLMMKHDRALSGVDGGNGLITRVSKLEFRWKFVVTFLIVISSGAVAILGGNLV